MRLGKCGLRAGEGVRRARRGLRCEPLEARRLLTIVFGSAPAAVTSDNGGPVLTHPQVELVFWGPGWGGAPGTLSRQIAADYSTILTSGYLGGLNEYRNGFGPGAVFGQAFISNSTPPASFTNGDVDTMLKNEIASGALPQPTAANNLYYFVVPTSGTSSPGLAGEHTYDFFGGHVFHYGWTVNSSNNIDSLTTIFSHELAEAASDPEGNAIQVNPRNATSWNEICDGNPANFDYRLNGVQVQSVLSSRQFHAYVVPTGQQQNFFVSGNGGTLTVNGDQLADQDDTIVIDRTSSGGVSVTLNGETVSFDLGKIANVVVNSGGGTDTVNILAAPVPLTINSASDPTGSPDQINVGNAGSTLRIASRITLNNTSGQDVINVDDSAESAARSLTLASAPGTGGAPLDGVITGLMPGAVFYPYDQVSGVNVRMGTGTTTVAARATGVPTSVVANGPETVTVGNAGSTQGVAGELNLDDLVPQMSLGVDDSGDASPRRVVFSTSMAGAWQDISGLAAAPIRYDAAALDPAQPVVINAGSGGNTFAINGLANPAASSSGITLNAGLGNDSVTIAATAPGMPLSVNGQEGDDTVVTDFGAGNIQPGMLSVDGGDGDNSLTVRGGGATDAFSILQAGQIAHSTAMVNYADIANLTLDNGSFAVAADLGAVSLGTVTAGTTLRLDSTQNLDSLDLAAGTHGVLTHSATPGGKSLNVNTLTLTGTLDLANNALGLTYGTGADPIQTIRSYLASGYDSGAWDGAGIVTSDFDAHHGLGFADSADGVIAALPAGTIVVKWARYGDLNLDGTVNFADLLALAQQYSQPSANWDQGDFNYDQTVGFPDLLALAQNYAAADALATAHHRSGLRI